MDKEVFDSEDDELSGLDLSSFYSSLGQDRFQIHSRQITTSQWVAEEKKVVILKPKGNYLKSMGTIEAGKHYLNWMETLFLSERGVLRVYEQGQSKEALELPALYALALENGMILEEFLVYGYLKRLGYIIKLHRPREVTIYNDHFSTRLSSFFKKIYYACSSAVHFFSLQLRRSFEYETPQNAMKRLQIVKEYNIPNIVRSFATFDVYKPTNTLSARNQMMPDCHVSVVCSPSVISLLHFPPTIPLQSQTCLALVHNGKISFFIFGNRKKTFLEEQIN